MSSDGHLPTTARRRRLPWVLWGLALVAIVPLGLRASGLGIAPAVLESRRVALASPRALRIIEIRSIPGVSVKAGDVLARLDPVDVDLELDIARGTLRELELDVAAKLAGARDARDVTVSRLSVEAEQTALDVSRLVTELESDRSELRALEAQVKLQEQLVNRRLVSDAALRDLRVRRDTLAAKVEAADEAVKLARRNADATKGRLGRFQPSSARRIDLDSQVAPARAAVEVQRERVRLLELVRDRLDLRAPFDGRVEQVLFQVGEVAAEGLPVVSVLDDRPAQAIAYVDERWAARVRLGDVVSLTPSDRSGPPRSGRVTSLGASIAEFPLRFRTFPTEPTFGRLVFVALDDAGGLPGQAYDASFTRGPEP